VSTDSSRISLISGNEIEKRATALLFDHHIVHTVDEALSEHPDMDDEARRRWVRRRREQIEAGELTYVAHQIDALGRVRE
jgi:hypothetical protein